MSYLSQPTSTTDFGVVKIGSNIQVQDGVISLAQSLDANSNPTFNSVTVTTNLTSFGSQVVTSVTPSAGRGIALANVVTGGPASSFEIDNTGVLSLTGGVGTYLNASTGNVILVNTGVVDFTASTGLASTGHSGNITVTNTGVVAIAAGNAINVSASTGNVVVTNTGVTQLTAGTGIALSGSTGNIVVATTGTSYINVIGITSNYTATLTDEYIGVYSAAGLTVTLPSGVAGRVYIIKDEYGQGSGKIVIQPQTGEKIDNANTYTISVPYQAVQIVFRAGQWRII